MGLWASCQSNEAFNNKQQQNATADETCLTHVQTRRKVDHKNRKQSNNNKQCELFIYTFPGPAALFPYLARSVDLKWLPRWSRSAQRLAYFLDRRPNSQR